MKLIIALLKDIDTELVTNTLVEAGFRVTRIASIGGFLKRGLSTVMIGVEEPQIEAAINIIREKVSPADDPGSHRATLFVLPVTEFTHM